VELNLFSIPPLIASLLTVLLGAFIYKQNKKSSQNIAYALECLSVFVWFLAYSIMFSCKDSSVASIFGKIGYIGVTFIPITFYHFTISLLGIKQRNMLRLCYFLGVVFLLLLFFTNLYIAGVNDHFWGFYTKAGPLHPLYLLFFMSLYNWSSLLLFKHMRNEKQDINRRKRIKFVLLAFFIPTFASIDFVPSYGVHIYPFGYVFIFAWLCTTAYAIVRHQLLNIEIIIKKTLVFAGLLASVFTILVLPTLLIQEYIFRGVSSSGRLLGLALSGVIIILSLRRIENFLINITDRYLFQKKYDYRELLRTFTSEVLTVVNLDNLVNLTVDKLTDIVKMSSSAVLLLDQEKQEFNVMASRNVKEPQVTLVRPDGIITFLEQTHGYLLRKDLIERKVYIPPSIQEIIDKLNAELIIPMVLHSEVMGILSLGKKKSDEDYTQDDLGILLPLASTLAIAISNARLFNELSKTQAEAAQNEKMAVIGTLSAGINHEICNPLGIARGQCEAFLLNVKDGLYNNKSSEELLTKAKEIMTKVIKETDRATAITKKLSSFAKPAKGEAELVNIDKEVDDVFGLVGYELKLEKIEFEKQIPEELPDIFVDRKQFQEVLFNLIRNAGQAIGEKGKIIVRVRQDRNKVSVDIKDTGSGIPEDKLKELFNPFFTTKEPGKGTGLGLFIVRQVVEKNGGKIYLKETKIGEGTTFTVEFPVTVGRESRA
jgi:signal transduction histidine kinase